MSEEEKKASQLPVQMARLLFAAAHHLEIREKDPYNDSSTIQVARDATGELAGLLTMFCLEHPTLRIAAQQSDTVAALAKYVELSGHPVTERTGIALQALSNSGLPVEVVVPGMEGMLQRARKFMLLALVYSAVTGQTFTDGD